MGIHTTPAHHKPNERGTVEILTLVPLRGVLACFGCTAPKYLRKTHVTTTTARTASTAPKMGPATAPNSNSSFATMPNIQSIALSDHEQDWTIHTRTHTHTHTHTHTQTHTRTHAHTGIQLLTWWRTSRRHKTEIARADASAIDACVTLQMVHVRSWIILSTPRDNF